MSKSTAPSPFALAIFTILSLQPISSLGAESLRQTIFKAENMPSFPSPYLVRDWKKTTDDYVKLIFDFDRKGEFLPFVSVHEGTKKTFSLPSYLGRPGAEGVNCIAAVVTGMLSGHDMTKYKGFNWVEMSHEFFSKQDGVYINNINSRVSGSFWYDIYPNILEYQLADRYRKKGGSHLLGVADQWYRASAAMGGKSEPFIVPNFDHTGFSFEEMKPTDNGHWIEPDSAAGIAWLEYMAYSVQNDPRYLTAAEWGLKALQLHPPEKNPLYEVLLPFGALTAARMNAEMGRDYDLQKLINWCFDAGDQRAARPGWGVIADRFGKVDCSGLVGTMLDTKGYAFAMNTFDWAGALTPVARYDPRFARSIGKWMHSLVNSARLFYPAFLPRHNQDNYDWSAGYDPASSIPYEGLRGQALRFASMAEDASHTLGHIESGSTKDTARLDNVTQNLVTTSVGGHEHLEHIWRIPVPFAGDHDLEIYSRCVFKPNTPHGFHYLWGQNLAGPYHPLFDITETDQITWHSGPLPNIEGGSSIYLKAVSIEGSGHQTLEVDQIRVRSLDSSLSPYGTGDAHGWGGPSNLCLYGGSHVGYLGAIVKTTSDKMIPRFDLLATDWFHAPAYPTYLLYNPFKYPRHVTFPIGVKKVDIYDIISHRYLQKEAVNMASIILPADNSLVTVLVPSGGRATIHKHQLSVNGFTIDYHAR